MNLSPTRRLTLLYLGVLSTIAFLSLSSHILIGRIIVNLSSDSRLINIAGRQRMLSQKLSKAVLAFHLETDPKPRQARIKEIQETLNLWSNSHKALQVGDPEIGLSRINSPQITQMFAEMESDYQVMVKATQELLAIARSQAENEKAAYLPQINTILRHENSFLTQMNDIVFQYDKESLEKVKRLRTIKNYILTTTIIVFLLEGIFVFHPVIKSIGNYVKEIQAAKDKSQTLASQLSQANEEVIRLNEQLKNDNLRLVSELETVRKIQQLILPKPHELQTIEELDIVGFMQAANQVGGDYYDVLESDGVVTIGIGDVTGHGLESGILMVMTQTAVRTLKEIKETNPVTFLATINRTIYKNIQRMQSDKNLSLAILNYAENILSISGQHEEIIIVRRGGKIERINTLDLGLPIGLDKDIDKFIDQTLVKLNVGDGVVLYTDGITEAKNINKKQYNLERLCHVISRNWHYSAKIIQEKIIADLTRHIGKQKVFDDITLLVFKVIQ